MSYLKTFETFHYSNLHRPNLIKIKVDELKDFCETYLAYLMDDAIKDNIHWDKIKDHFLQFLQMVQKEYVFREDNEDKMCSIAWRIEDSLITIARQYTLEELLEDKIETNFTLKRTPNDLRTFSNLSIQGNVGSIKLEILEEVSKD